MRDDDTLDLLQRWQDGDADALRSLVERDLPWIRQRIRARLGALLRRRDESEDIVQLAMVEFLRDGPRFVVADQAQFRALLARIVENVIRAELDKHTCKQRDLRKEIPLASGSTVDLRGFTASGTSPSQAAANSELHALLRIALELLPPEEHSVVVMRVHRQLGFAEIGKELGMPEKTAQRRFARGLRMLVACMDRLRRGRLGDVVGA